MHSRVGFASFWCTDMPGIPGMPVWGRATAVSRSAVSLIVSATKGSKILLPR
jgi:hypothetical protein